MPKQYITKPAYTGNTMVVLYENGRKVNSKIISDWALSGYLDRIEDEGYEKAFDEDYYLREYEKAKEALDQAIQNLEMARAHPLYI